MRFFAFMYFFYGNCCDGVEPTTQSFGLILVPMHFFSHFVLVGLCHSAKIYVYIKRLVLFVTRCRSVSWSCDRYRWTDQRCAEYWTWSPRDSRYRRLCFWQPPVTWCVEISSLLAIVLLIYYIYFVICFATCELP